NASSAILLWARKAGRVSIKVRAALQENLPQYDWSRVEIYPDNSKQVFAPLQRQKMMIIDKTLPKLNGHYSCKAYLNWLFFETTPLNLDVVRQELEKAVGKPIAGKKRSSSSSRKNGPGCMGSIGRMKGRCRAELVGFLTGAFVPPDDTIGIYT